MKPTYHSIADFEAVKLARVIPALSCFSIDTKNKNKLDEATARFLGYDSYNAIKPLHDREIAIKTGIHLEHCPLQGGALTVKSGNVLLVFDEHEQTIRVRVLSNGQEHQYVTQDNQTGSIRFTDLGVEPSLSFALERMTITAKTETVLSLALPAQNHSGASAEAWVFHIQRNPDKLILAVLHPDDRGDVFAYEFDDCGDHAQVDQAYASLCLPTKGLEGEHYRWMRAVVDYDGVTARLVTMGEDNEVAPSEILWGSYDEAATVLRNEDWGGCWEADEFREGVIVKVTHSVVGRPTQRQLEADKAETED